MARFLGWYNFMRRRVYAPRPTCAKLRPEEFTRVFAQHELMHPWARRRGSRPPEEYLNDDTYYLTRWNRTKPFEKEG